jgi:hypothetical protein
MPEKKNDESIGTAGVSFPPTQPRGRAKVSGKVSHRPPRERPLPPQEEIRPQLAADMFGEQRGRNRPDAIRRDENDYSTERIR